MEKKIYRRVNLIKALILFIVIVCIVLINLIIYSNVKEKNSKLNIPENNLIIKNQ